MKPLLVVAGIAVCGLAAFALPKGDGKRYLVTGASTVLPVVQEVTARLEQADPSLKFHVEAGGSSRGINDARGKKVDCGMSSRDLTSDEKQGLDCHLIAKDGVAIVVHKERGLADITRQQVIAIWTGVTTNWKDLGGPDAPIKVLNKAEGRSTLEIFCKGFGLKPSEIKAHAIVGDNAQCVRLVSGDPLAIGYLSIGEALHAIQRGEPLTLPKLDGIVASQQTVQDGTFPLGRPLYLLFPGTIDPTGQRIVDYVKSPAGTQVLLDLGFVPLRAD